MDIFDIHISPIHTYLCVYICMCMYMRIYIRACMFGYFQYPYLQSYKTFMYMPVNTKINRTYMNIDMYVYRSF